MVDFDVGNLPVAWSSKKKKRVSINPLIFHLQPFLSPREAAYQPQLVLLVTASDGGYCSLMDQRSL